MARSIEWMKLTAAEVQAEADADALLIIPVASLEQHGPHLVTGTDTSWAAMSRWRRRGGSSRPGIGRWSRPSSGMGWPSITWPLAAP